MGLVQICYASAATTPFSREELKELLAKSRANNESRGITGILLYKDGNFFQVLEGESETVRDLLKIINRDPRHRGVLVLMQRQIHNREFDDWSMAFRNLGDPSVQEMEGYNEFLNVPFARPEVFKDEPKAFKLIASFAASIR